MQFWHRGNSLSATGGGNKAIRALSEENGVHVAVFRGLLGGKQHVVKAQGWACRSLLLSGRWVGTCWLENYEAGQRQGSYSRAQLLPGRGHHRGGVPHCKQQRRKKDV